MDMLNDMSCATKSSDVTIEMDPIYVDDYHLDQKTLEFFLSLYYPEDVIVDVTPYIVGLDTLFYLFNFEQGWKALSADMRTKPIMAGGDSGRCTLDIPAQSPERDWINLSEEILIGS